MYVSNDQKKPPFGSMYKSSLSSLGGSLNCFTMNTGGKSLFRMGIEFSILTERC
jgi:hypothetical protein